MGAGAIVSSIKIKSRVAAGYTVGASEYVVATYAGSIYNTSSGFTYAFGPSSVWYGPGDSVQASAPGTSTALVTAVCFINSP